MGENTDGQWTLPTLKVLMDERFAAIDKALELQAEEYSRRLKDLNGEYIRDRERQNDYVTVEKYEDKLAAEAQARDVALTRVDEKFQDYVKRYEVRQREVDQALSMMKGAADQAQRAIEEQARRTNRNIAILGLALAVLVALANYIGSL